MPVAKILVNTIGAIARIPVASVRAIALRVPSVVGDGETSFRASCMAAMTV